MAISTEAFIEAMSTRIADMLIRNSLEEHWDIFDKRAEVTEEKFKPKLVDAFSKQERMVIARMRKKPVPDLGKAAPDIESGWSWLDYALDYKAISSEAEAAAEVYLKGVFDPKTQQVTFEEVARPFVTEAFIESGEAALVEVGIGTGFNVTDPRAKKILDERVFKFAEEVNLTTQARLRTALATGFDKGEGVRQLSERVAKVFDIAKGSRTDTIARTEVVGASNQGAFQGYTDSEIVDTIIWVETKDDRTRPAHTSHSGVGGEEIKLGKTFSNGLRHPHDPSGSAGEVINCRCTTRAGKLKKVA